MKSEKFDAKSHSLALTYQMQQLQKLQKAEEEKMGQVMSKKPSPEEEKSLIPPRSIINKPKTSNSMTQ